MASFLAHHSITLPVLLPGALNSEGGRGKGRGKVAGGNKQKRARLEVFDKWQKKSPGDSQRRKESRPARRSVSGVGSFSTRLAASPLSLSVSHLLGNSLAPPSSPLPLFTVRTASQSAFQV